jgi:hypothetical protein
LLSLISASPSWCRSASNEDEEDEEEEDKDVNGSGGGGAGGRADDDDDAVERGTGVVAVVSTVAICCRT